MDKTNTLNYKIKVIDNFLNKNDFYDLCNLNIDRNISEVIDYVETPTFEEVPVELGQVEKSVVNSIRYKNKYYNPELGRNEYILTGMQIETRIKQFSINPMSCGYNIVSSKEKALDKLMEEQEGKRVVIFATSVDFVENYSTKLVKQGLRANCLHGGSKNKQETIANFRYKSVPIFHGHVFRSFAVIKKQTSNTPPFISMRIIEILITSFFIICIKKLFD